MSIAARPRAAAAQYQGVGVEPLRKTKASQNGWGVKLMCHQATAPERKTNRASESDRRAKLASADHRSVKAKASFNQRAALSAPHLKDKSGPAVAAIPA